MTRLAKAKQLVIRAAEQLVDTQARAEAGKIPWLEIRDCMFHLETAIRHMRNLQARK